MHGATCSTSSRACQACSGGTGMMNECSRSMSLSSSRDRQRPSGQHPRQMAPVVGRAVQVCRRLRVLVGVRCGRPQGATVGLGPGDRLFRRPGPHRNRAHVREPDAGLRHMPIGTPGNSGHPHGRPRLGRPVELLITIAPCRAEFGHPDPGEYLAGRQRGGQVVPGPARARSVTRAAPLPPGPYRGPLPPWAALYRPRLPIPVRPVTPGPVTVSRCRGPGTSRPGGPRAARPARPCGPASRGGSPPGRPVDRSGSRGPAARRSSGGTCP